MSEAMPDGWTLSQVGDVVCLNPKHPRDLDERLVVAFVPMSCISESRPDLERREERPFGEVRKGYTHFADGDVLFAKITPCMENGKGAVARNLRNGLGCGTTELHVLRPSAAINSYYLYYFLFQEKVRQAAAHNFTGSAGQLRVPLSYVSELMLPIPPLAEQQRIIAALDAVLAKVASCRERLARIPTLLKRFRQAVLAAACSGRLTADWRNLHGDIESAGGLLKRMSNEREDHWKTCRPKSKYRPPLLLNNDDLPDLPPSWAWTSFDHCSREITVGHVGPMKNRYVHDGVPFLRSQNVRPLRFDSAGLATIPAQFHLELRKSALYGGEILVTRSGANTGDCCVYPTGATEANCADLVITRPLTGLVAHYGAAYIASPEGQARIGLSETGIAQPHFNIGAMRVKPFPLPPFAEQQEIVRRVDALFAVADQLEARYEQARRHVDRLAQSVLAKAFRGELVPTEHALAAAAGRDYESAEALLARVKATSPSATQAPRRSKKSRA